MAYKVVLHDGFGLLDLKFRRKTSHLVTSMSTHAICEDAIE